MPVSLRLRSRRFSWGFFRYGGRYRRSSLDDDAPDVPEFIRRFRKRAVMNTYGETSPGFDLASVRKSFQIGVDRILIRTVP
jgi:hypothetical protein